MVKRKLEPWKKLLISLSACLLAGVVGSLFTAPAIASWYVTLRKPSFTPPDWLFAPVWTLLYVLMGIALFLVWKRGKTTTKYRMGIVFFAAQLVLNAAWSFVFFGMHLPKAGFIVIILLWLAIATTIVEFRKVSKVAAMLLVPYLLWVSFASALNFAIMRLN